MFYSTFSLSSQSLLKTSPDRERTWKHSSHPLELSLKALRAGARKPPLAPLSSSYFSVEDISYPSLKEISFYHRRHRRALPSFSRKQAFLYKPNVALQFQAGDILSVTVTKELEGHMFTGICLGVRRGSLSSLDTTVILRNVLFGVGVEVIFSLFENRAYRIRFEDHLRKSFFYSKNKLFYLRRRPGNQATRS